MGFKQKQDYYGLSAITGIVLKSVTENKSNEVVEAKDEKGFVIANQIFGEKSTPSQEYVITKNVELSSIKLGQITTVNDKRYALTGIDIKTGAGSEITMTVNGQQVEDDDGSLIEGCKVTLSGLSISGIHHAQTFGAFTISGTGAHLTESSIAITTQVSQSEVEGEIVAHDINDARMTITGTIQVSNPSYPTPVISCADGWVQTEVLSEDNPDSDYPTYSFTLVKYLKED